MKHGSALVAVLALCFGGGLLASGQLDDAGANPPYKMVEVCHTDDGGETFHPLVIPKWSLDDHLAHGDVYPVPANGCPSHEHPPPTTTTTPEPPTTTTEPEPPTTTEPGPPTPPPDDPPSGGTTGGPPPTSSNHDLPHTGLDAHWLALLALALLASGSGLWWLDRRRRREEA